MFIKTRKKKILDYIELNYPCDIFVQILDDISSKSFNSEFTKKLRVKSETFIKFHENKPFINIDYTYKKYWFIIFLTEEGVNFDIHKLEEPSSQVLEIEKKWTEFDSKNDVYNYLINEFEKQYKIIQL